MLKKVTVASLLLAASFPALAQEPSAPAPRLIVAIAVDQFSADLFSEYRPYYSDGLKRLSEGAVFPRGYQSHAATETCPGHSTILTGSRPSRTGIIANSWFDLKTPREDRAIYCAEDESQPGSSSGNYVASSIHLRVPTLGGRMKAANPATRVVSIAGKDRAAIMMAGPNADQVWWLGPKGYVSYQGVQTPPLVAKVNEVFAQRLAQPNPGFELPAQCTAKDFPVNVGGGRTVGTGRFAREAGSFAGFRASPEQDAMTLAFAAAAIDTMQLGKQAQTDIISIGLSASDVIGHAYGTEGTESCIQVDRLDRELGAFFDRLDSQGLDYVVVLTADHGGHDLPERHRQNAMSMEQRVDSALLPGALAAAVASSTGISRKLIYADGPAGDLYFDRTLTATERAKVEKATLALLRAHPQIETVFTKAQLAATPSPSGPPESWSLLQEARASFDPERSGDLLVLLKPRVTPISDPVKGYVATHGSPWDADRRVPILFWRKGMRHFEQPLGVETVDIMPTLAALVRLPLSGAEIDGRCLDLVAGEGDSCPAR